MNVDDCFESLRTSYLEWGDYFVNRRFYAEGGLISWSGNNAPRHSSLLGADEFSRLVEGQQYSFQRLEDGSIFRIHYQFDPRGRQIKRASLAYVSAPRGEEFCIGPAGVVDYEGLCGWLRIDYESVDGRVPNHAACHLHLSGMPTARIPLSRLPTPRQFISWIMSLTAPDRHDVFFGADGTVERLNAPSFTEHWVSELRSWVHLAVPPPAVDHR